MAWSKIIDRFRSLQGRHARSRAEAAVSDTPGGMGVPAAKDALSLEEEADTAEAHSTLTVEAADVAQETPLEASAPEPLLPPQPATALDAAPPENVPPENTPETKVPAASAWTEPTLSPQEQLAAQWAARRAVPSRTPRSSQPAPIAHSVAEVAASATVAVHTPEQESGSPVLYQGDDVTQAPSTFAAPLEAESSLPGAVTAPDAASAHHITSTTTSAQRVTSEPKPPDALSETMGGSIDSLHFETPHSVQPLPGHDDGPFTTVPPAEDSAILKAPPAANDVSKNVPVSVAEAGPGEEEKGATLPAHTLSIPPNDSPASLVLPSTPWALRAAGPSELAPAPRFAMLHALARRWHQPLPTRRFLLSVGSRSEARKLAPVIRSLRSRAAAERRPEEVLVCATGADPQTVRHVLESLHITVDCNLDIISAGEDAAATSARMLSSFESLLAQVKPQWLIVEGATTASAMASVAAYYAGIRVARVEGGPAPFNVDDLYPSEIIRQVVGLFSSVHFAETDWSREHLVQEGVPDEEIFVIGNTGVDAVHETCAELGLPLGSTAARSSGVVKVLIVLQRGSIAEPQVIELCHVVRNLAGSVPGLYEFVWPLPSSATLIQTVHELLDRVPGVTLTPPADYTDILRGIHACDIVLTNSPELQEEAPSLGKPVLVMRESVDRPEAVRAGVAMLVGTARAGIQAAVRTLARKLSSRHGLITNPYGDGRAAARIADFFEGRQVLEFGRSTQPRRLPPVTPLTAPLQLEASIEG